MTLWIKNGGYAFLLRLNLMFSVSFLCYDIIMKEFPMITNFKRTIYQTFD